MCFEGYRLRYVDVGKNLKCIVRNDEFIYLKWFSVLHESGTNKEDKHGIAGGDDVDRGR